MRRLRWFSAPCVSLLVTCLWAAPHVWAQGTSGTLPDPMTTGEVERYGRRLGLSAAQQEASQRLHDQYKEEFRALRDGEIAAFMGTMRSFENAGAMPGRKQIETFFDEMDRLGRRIEAVDRRFFDRLSEVLSEGQLERMPRVVQARQRKRHQAGQMVSGMLGGRALDLSELLLDLHLTAQEVAAVDPMVAPYETRLTAALREMYETNRSVITSTLDALEQRGITEATWSDPAKLQEVQAAMQEVFMSSMAKSFKLVSDLNQINRRAYTQWSPLLSPARSAEFRQRFLQSAYPMLAHVFDLQRAPFDEASARPGLAAEQIAAIDALFERVQRDLDRCAGEGIGALDEAGAESLAQMWTGGDGAWKAQQEAIEKTVARATAVRAAAAEELSGIVGVRIAGVAPDADTARTAGVVVGPGGMVVQTESGPVALEGIEAAPDAWSGDEFLPAPLSSTHGERIKSALALGEPQAAFVDGLLEEYRGELTQFRSGHLAKLHEAQAAMWHQAENGTMTMSPEAPGALMDRRRAARDVMLRMDEAFFERLAQGLSIAPDQLEMLRLERRRETFLGRGMGLAWMQSHEVTADVPRMTRDLELGQSLMGSLKPALRLHLESLVPALDSWSQAAMEWECANHRLQAGSMSLQDGKTFDLQEYQRLYREHLEPAQQRLRDAARVVEGLNREGLEAIIALLPEGPAHLLRRQYREKAFPEVYNDATAVEAHLTKARELADLAPQQRRHLDELAGEYLPAYTALCDRMVARSRENPGFSFGADTGEWAKVQEHQEAMARLRFDRLELNGRAVARLRQVLSAEQVAAVGALPDVSVSQGQNWWE